MKKTRLFIALLLVAALFVTLAACGETNDPVKSSGDEEPVPSESVDPTPSEGTDEPVPSEGTDDPVKSEAEEPVPSEAEEPSDPEPSEPSDPAEPTEHVHAYGEWIAEVAATCTKAGTKAHYHCAGCGKDFDASYHEINTAIPVTAHKEETVKGYAATCVKTGLTDGKKCSVCGQILTKQTEIAKADHTYGTWIAEVAATSDKDGVKGHYHCSVCGGDFDNAHNALSSLVIPATGASEEQPYVPPVIPDAPTDPEGAEPKYDTAAKFSFKSLGGGTCEVTFVSSATGNVLIPDKSPAGDKVVAIADYAFDGQTGVKYVKIPAGVKKIGVNAFRNCSSLVTVKIPDTVTEICEYAFFYCSALRHADFPASVTTLSRSVMLGCSSLKAFNIRNTVTEIAPYAFAGCYKLDTRIPASVKSIGDHAFVETAITYAVIPDGVKVLANDVFNGCKSLKVTVLPEGMTEIGENAFKDCESLTNVHLPKTLTLLASQCFYGCKAMTEIVIPDSVKETGFFAFYNCTGVKKVIIGKGLETYGSRTFGGYKPAEVFFRGEKADYEWFRGLPRADELTSAAVKKTFGYTGN